jgi:hypothetical protein
MPIYWVHSTLGSDLRTSVQAQSSGTPWKTLGKLRDNAVDSTTGYLFGTFYNQPVQFNNINGLCLTNWPNQPMPQLLGAENLSIGSFTNQGSGVYSCFPQLISNNVRSIAVNWGINLDASGRYYGHIPVTGSLAACQAGPNTCFYDTGDGTLYVNLAGRAPNFFTNLLAVDNAGIPTFGLDLQSCTGYSISNLKIGLWLSPSAYGARTVGPNGYIGYCSGIDLDVHTINPVGKNVSNTLMEYCTFMGMGSNAANTVIHSNGVDTSGVLVKNCDHHAYCILNVSGVPLNSGLVLDGFYSHNDGTKTYDLEFRDCTVLHYENPNSFAFAAIDTSETISDELNYLTYPVRFVRCNQYNGYSNNVFGSGAFKQCRFHIPRAGILPGQGYAYSFYLYGKVLFDTCDIIWRASTSTNLVNSIFLVNGKKLNILDSTIINNSADANIQRRFFIIDNANDRIYARRTNFVNINDFGGGFPLMRGNDNSASGRLDIKNCWYYNFEPNVGYGEVGSSFTSKSGFQSIIDQSGIYDIPVSFVNSNLNGDLALNGSGYAYKLLPLQRSFVSINNGNSDGHIGSWQYDFGGSKPRDVLGLIALLSLDSIHVL